MAVTLPSGREEMPPGVIRYMVYAVDRGDINGKDKAHRRRWALPLNQRVPLYLAIIDAGHVGLTAVLTIGTNRASTMRRTSIWNTLSLWKHSCLAHRFFIYPGHPEEPFSPRPPLVPLVCAWTTRLTRSADVKLSPDDRKDQVREFAEGWLKEEGARREVFLISLHCDGGMKAAVRGVSVGYCRLNPYGSGCAMMWFFGYAAK